MRLSLSQNLSANYSSRSSRTLVEFLHEQQRDSVHFVTVLLTIVYIFCLFCVASTRLWTPLRFRFGTKRLLKKQPIINAPILWHPWERAIYLKEYQFLTVFYKVLPSRTSDGKVLCGG